MAATVRADGRPLWVTARPPLSPTYSGRVPAFPPRESVAPAVAALRRVRDRVLAVEDDVLSGFAVLGEPLAQRVLDDWLDHAADTLRLLAEEAAVQVRLLSDDLPVRPAEHDPERGPGVARPDARRPGGGR